MSWSSLRAPMIGWTDGRRARVQASATWDEVRPSSSATVSTARAMPRSRSLIFSAFDPGVAGVTGAAELAAQDAAGER